jgi:hypothetical protein
MKIFTWFGTSFGAYFWGHLFAKLKPNLCMGLEEGLTLALYIKIAWPVPP